MRNDVYWSRLFSIRDRVAEADRDRFDYRFAMRQKNPVLILACSLFFGQYGVDRFLLGHIGYGFAKLALGLCILIINAAGFYVWWRGGELPVGLKILVPLMAIPVLVDFFLVTD